MSCSHAYTHVCHTHSSDVVNLSDDSDDDDSSGERLFTLVADCLMSIVLSCHELVQTKPTNTIDGILKVTTVPRTHTACYYCCCCRF